MRVGLTTRTGTRPGWRPVGCDPRLLRMSTPRDVVVLVGSLRKDSWNRKVADLIAGLAPPHLKLTQVDWGHLSYYNQDLDADPPKDWVEFRKRIKAADAVLLVTPEYNRSLPGGFKNAIDIASRPYGQNVFDGKPGAVVSASIGNIGGFGAHHNLRQSLAYLNVATMPQPEVYLSNVASLIDETGKLKQDSTRAHLQKFGQAFADWIDRVSPR